MTSLGDPTPFIAFGRTKSNIFVAGSIFGIIFSMHDHSWTGIPVRNENIGMEAFFVDIMIRMIPNSVGKS